jgi:hypothetical protein
MSEFTESKGAQPAKHAPLHKDIKYVNKNPAFATEILEKVKKKRVII